MESTTASSLLDNEEFIVHAVNKVPAKELTYFAPDRSLRWMQEVCKTARDQNPSKPFGPFDFEYQVETYGRQSLKDAAEKCAALAMEPVRVVPSWTRALDLPTKKQRIPDSVMSPQTGWMKLTGDYAVVTDVHVPYHHVPTLERLMDDAEKVGVRDLIIGGDLFDFNMFHHARGSQYQRRGQDDVEIGRGVLKGLLEHFQTIKIFMGNHDMYLANNLRNQFDPDFLFSKFFGEFSNRIEWSRYGHCDVVSGNVKWKITHGTSFSETNPLGPAKKMAEKFSCNIVVGHQHRVAEAFGKYHCVCLGGAHDAEKMAYLNHHPTPNETPARSYGILKDGWFQHIIENLNTRMSMEA